MTAIELRQFADQDPDRPAVGDNMMDRENEQVLLRRGLQQPPAQQWAASQIKTPRRLLAQYGSQACGPLDIGLSAEVDNRKRHGEGLMHRRDRFTIVLRERGPKRLVTTDHLIQA